MISRCRAASAERPTVLIAINSSWNIYHFRAALVAALRTQGYRVESAAPHDAYTARLEALVDMHHDLPMDTAGTSPLRDLLLLYRYVRLLRRVKPSVLLTYTIKPTIYGSLAARLCGIPVINNISGLGTAFIRRNWLTVIVSRLYRLALRRSACVFFQNTEDRDLFIAWQLVQPSATHVLAGSGVDLDYFKPRDTARDPAAPLHFVVIARLLWDKGIGEYVAAARIVKAQHPQAVFRLVGPRGVENKTAIATPVIDAWVAEGMVEYLGETEAVRQVIAQHDCVVLPSYREGLSRVLLEAAAMGKPIITTDVPGCRQVVTHGGNGLLCRARDAADLAQTMLQFIALSEEQRAQMGAASRHKAEQEFDQLRVIDAYRTRIAAVIG